MSEGKGVEEDTDSDRSKNAKRNEGTITDSNMETGLQLGSLLLQVGSQMMDLTWSNKDPSNKAVSIFETVIRIRKKTSKSIESISYLGVKGKSADLLKKESKLKETQER